MGPYLDLLFGKKNLSRYTITILNTAFTLFYSLKVQCIRFNNRMWRSQLSELLFSCCLKTLSILPARGELWSQHDIQNKQNHIFLTLCKSFFNNLNHYPFNPVTSLVFFFYSLAVCSNITIFILQFQQMFVHQGNAQSFRWLFGISSCDALHVISFNGSIMWSPIQLPATSRVHRVQCWIKSACLLSKIKTPILWMSQCIIKHVLNVSRAWCIWMTKGF